MTEAMWLPALLVLSVGLILGLLLAFRLRGSSARPSRAETADLDLKLRDLEARRDDLFRRLQAADEDRISTEERASLEEAAAVTLREIDLLQERTPTADSPRSRPSVADDKDEPAVPSPPGAHRSLLTGLAIGAVMVLVVGVLVYWAVRDAQPSDGMGGPPAEQAGSPSTEPPHEGQIQVPPELAAQIAELQQRTIADPEDWMARKQLALTLVAAGQFFEAFDQASQVLRQFPDDPDGLLVHGVVRLTMGQADQSVQLLDRVLAEHPDHRQALIYRGLALYQLGNVEQALDTWDMGLQMAGGSDPELEELIMRARSGQLQATAGQPTQTPAAGTPSAPPRDTAPPDVPGVFSLQIELASAAARDPNAVLFVFLRPEGGGPPVAATRITAPSFPVTITLDASHSMMGAELPDRGIMIARLDTDGNVTTSQTTDLVAELPASKGSVVRMVLGQ